jgi:hypothetical protein
MLLVVTIKSHKVYYILYPFPCHSCLSYLHHPSQHNIYNMCIINKVQPRDSLYLICLCMSLCVYASQPPPPLSPSLPPSSSSIIWQATWECTSGAGRCCRTSRSQASTPCCPSSPRVSPSASQLANQQPPTHNIYYVVIMYILNIFTHSLTRLTLDSCVCVFFLGAVVPVQVTIQTDSVNDIPCGTSGGVMILFDKVTYIMLSCGPGCMCTGERLRVFH